MPSLRPSVPYFALLLPSFLSACVNETPLLDAQWGHSLSHSQAQQTAYPEHQHITRPPIETDALTTRLGLERYQKSFENPPPPANVLNLGMGTSGNAR